MIIGYTTIFTMVMILSLYAVMQIRQFSAGTRAMLDIDDHIIDYEKKLTDSLLSQVRYERKYLIIKDDSLNRQFLVAADDFLRYMEAAASLAETSQKNEEMQGIKNAYLRYRSLVEQEALAVRDGIQYPKWWYKREKDKAVSLTMEKLKDLGVACRESMHARVIEVGKAGEHARSAVAGMAFVVLALGIAVSFFITRSINKPLSLMVEKTREIEGGVMNGDLKLSSPQEIGELAAAFNSMCRKLNALDKLKSDFFSTMSHELRTPLTSIKEGTNLLLEGKGGTTTEKQRKLLTIISEESNRMIGLVNSLMDLSKMESGMMKFNFVNADIGPLIGKVVAEAEILASIKKVCLSVECAPELPRVRIDRERILQALRNLVANAVKFSPHAGKVMITAANNGGNLKIGILDSGPGIQTEYLGLIFEKFQQVPCEGTYKGKGTGLGLAIVKYIIEAHGGKVWAESEPGHGSSFFFVLPV